MKFGETFKEYLEGEQERFLLKCSHVDYKRLKKVLKSCKLCQAAAEAARGSGRSKATQVVEDQKVEEDDGSFPNTNPKPSDDTCHCESCELCDEMFFTELEKETTEIVRCFRTKVRRLIHLHDSSGLRGYIHCLQHCFINSKSELVQEGMVLTDYVTANAIAIRKILKKYDKIHGSVNGKNFNMKMRAEHIGLLHSPWLIELGAFYLNFCVSEIGEPGEFFKQFSCDLSSTQPMITLVLSDDVKLEYSLTCAVCLDTVFQPYALGCGHLFCKACALQAGSLQLFESIKLASRGSKCPLCREVGVYTNAVPMLELALLLKTKCHEYWHERKYAESKEMNEQLRQHYEAQKQAFVNGAW